MTGTVQAVAGASAPSARPARPRGPLRLARLAGAVAAGLALLLAFPPYGLWWLAPVGVALLDLALLAPGRSGRATVRAGTVLGLLCGAVLFAPLLSWTRLHELGALPWLLLSGLEAAYLGLLGALAAFVGPLAARWRWSGPLLTALLWTGQEALRARTPFGGFPWGRLAFSQGDGPLLRLASLGGAPLVTFAVALVGGLLAAAARAGLHRRWPRAGLTAAAAAGLVAAGLAVPAPRPSGAPVTVAFVQGNVPRLGLDFNAQRRAVLDNHVDATLYLARRVADGSVPRPALVVWPENASDIDPLVNDDAAARITQAADAVGVPILLGAVLEGPGERARNAALVWLPGARGPAQMYVKRHPVPFAEYVPLRSLARTVTTAVDRAGDFVGGDRPGVLAVGPVTVGDAICFEVAYDAVIRDTVTGGAQLLVVQTNNATFDRAEAAQQLAMVRLRAVEHGREALMVSTVGISAFVDTRGAVSDATRFDTGAVKVRELHTGATRTLASRIGAAPEYAAVVAALVVLLLAARLRGRARRVRAATRVAGPPSAARPGGPPSEGEV